MNFPNEGVESARVHINQYILKLLPNVLVVLGCFGIEIITQEGIVEYFKF